VGGIIIAKDTNGDLEVADGFKGYDAAGDKTLIPGASGGAAFNSLGQLVGISIEATPANKPLTAAQMAGKYAVHLTGTPRDSSVFDITVQTITNNELNNLETSLPETDNCAVS
jgi:hypothetical protein